MDPLRIPLDKINDSPQLRLLSPAMSIILSRLTNCLRACLHESGVYRGDTSVTWTLRHRKNRSEQSRAKTALGMFSATRAEPPMSATAIPRTTSASARATPLGEWPFTPTA